MTYARYDGGVQRGPTLLAKPTYRIGRMKLGGRTQCPIK